MKKILVITLLLALSFGILAVVPVQAETAVVTNASISANGQPNLGDLEKISSPDQIRYFRVMKKENGALYGIRLEKLSQNEKIKVSAGLNQADSVTATNTKAQLEKILAPHLISLYEKVQKIGTSLWGVKKDKNNIEQGDKKGESKDETKPVVKYRVVTPEMLTCVTSAIDKKDNALQARVTSTGVDVNAAIAARGTCQKQALASVENQQENMKVCVQKFQEKHREIVAKAKTEQQAIWKTYQTELKACVPVIASGAAEAEAELIIEDGGSASLEVMLSQ